MKREQLWLCNVTMQVGGQTVLDALNLHILEGECFGILLENAVGAEQLLQLLQQNRPLDNGHIYFGGQLVNTWQHSDNSRNRVVVIDEHSALIPSLSIAENICIRQRGRFWIRRGPRNRRVAALAQSLGLALNPSARAGTLDGCEARAVELIRAIETGAQLVVLKDLSNFLSEQERRRFHQFVRRYSRQGVTFLQIGAEKEELLLSCDRLAVMRNGRLQKIYTQPAALARRVAATTCAQPEPSAAAAALMLEDVWSERLHGLTFHAGAGECVLLEGLDFAQIHELLDVLGGRTPLLQGRIRLGGRPFGPLARKQAVHSGVCVILEHPDQGMLCKELSYLDNLCIYLSAKTGAVVKRRSVLRSVISEYEPLLGAKLHAPNLHGLNQQERFDLVYHRVHLLNPSVLLIVQPLGSCDLPLRRHILELIRMLKQRGICVVLLGGSPFELQSVADRVVPLGPAP